MSTDGWTDSKMSAIQTMECYSVVKRKKILIPPMMWTNLENVGLSEKGQSQKDKYWVILLI